jgi:hypothetical protein
LVLAAMGAQLTVLLSHMNTTAITEDNHHLMQLLHLAVEVVIEAENSLVAEGSVVLLQLY